MLAGWVVRLRAGLVGGDSAGGGWVRGAVCVVFSYLILNTVADAVSTSKIERLVMGSITAVAAVGVFMVAFGA